MITYYWPPSGGAGVHRWLRFSRYFKENGCNLTVYCPSDAAWPVIDKELEKDVPSDVKVIRHSIFEPHKYLGGNKNAGVGFTQKKKASLAKKMIVWVRGNLFIPDSRVFWIKPSIRFLSSYLKEHPEIDTIISTGPPHSTHLIARGLKKRFKLRWIADFRDPWTQIDFYQDLLPGKKADEKHKKLEKAVLTEADEVVTVSQSCADGLEAISGRNVHVITNGYIFPSFDPALIELDKNFTIAYFGSMPNGRNPEVLWKALKSICSQNEAFAKHVKIRLVGTVDYKVLKSAEDYSVREFIELVDPVSHKASIEMQRKSQLLLLVGNNTGNVKGILTGKFFEYLGAKRPIISIGQKDSDLNKAMKDTEAGYFADFDDVGGMMRYLNECFNLFKEEKLYHSPVNTEKYDSSELVKSYVRLIHEN